MTRSGISDLAGAHGKSKKQDYCCSRHARVAHEPPGHCKCSHAEDGDDKFCYFMSRLTIPRPAIARSAMIQGL
jgi:hypothetical protein